MPHTDKPFIGKATPEMLAARLRDAQARYEQTFGHPVDERDLAGCEGWARVEWLDQAVATAQIPKGPAVYDPPPPYRVFRLIRGDRADPTDAPPPQATPDL